MGHGSCRLWLRFHPEEEFRREGKDAVVGLGVEECAIGSGLEAAQAAIESGGTARRLDPDGNGEVELIDVAGADQGVNFIDSLGVLLFGNCEGAFEDRMGTGRGWVAGQRGKIASQECAAFVVEDVRGKIDTEPG
jgi:hypothetical protein